MAIEGIIGKKVGMTQVFAEDGAVVPVTVIQAGPCLVVQKKTTDKDGYDAVQIGLVEKISNRRITSAQRGHFEKAGLQPLRTLAEVPYSGDANVGDKVQVDIFKAGVRSGWRPAFSKWPRCALVMRRFEIFSTSPICTAS